MTEEVWTRDGGALVREVVERRVNRYELQFLREQKKRLKAELDEVQVLIDKAVALKVEEVEEPVMEGLDAK